MFAVNTKVFAPSSSGSNHNSINVIYFHAPKFVGTVWG